jgi:hypothetical protein
LFSGVIWLLILILDDFVELAIFSPYRLFAPLMYSIPAVVVWEVFTFLGAKHSKKVIVGLAAFCLIIITSLSSWLFYDHLSTTRIEAFRKSLNDVGVNWTGLSYWGEEEFKFQPHYSMGGDGLDDETVQSFFNQAIPLIAEAIDRGYVSRVSLSIDDSENQITELDALRNIRSLQDLDIWSDSISDFSVLSNLINLENLKCQCDQFSDFSILENLQNLKHLDFGIIEEAQCEGLRAFKSKRPSIAVLGEIWDLEQSSIQCVPAQSP